MFQRLVKRSLEKSVWENVRPKCVQDLSIDAAEGENVRFGFALSEIRYFWSTIPPGV